MLETKSPKTQLQHTLQQLGIDATLTYTPGSFPLCLPCEDGTKVELFVPSPTLLSEFDNDELGVALVNADGMTVSAWGLAKRLPVFRKGRSIFATPLATLIKQDGGVVFADGARFMAAHGEEYTTILVNNAREELKSRKLGQRYQRVANTLKRLGKALTMNQTRLHSCVAAAHEIASAADLAAILIWTTNEETDTLQLMASVGVNKNGINALSELTPSRSACIPELVALERKPFYVHQASHHLLTAEFESRFTYLKAGGISVQPLVISDHLVGVLEFIGKEGDPMFDESEDLFETIAEHLALALNSANLYERAEQLASHDALTGIANHRHLQDFLMARINECERTLDTLGLVMIDVDHFRSFNEEEGHDAGDEVLKLVAQRLKKAVRPYDLAARYGGEEFTVVLPGVSQEIAMALCERLRDEIASIEYLCASGRKKQITISLGLALYPQTSRTPGDLFKAADIALYESKKNGRDRTTFFKGAYKGESRKSNLNITDLVEKLPKKTKIQGQALLQEVGDTLTALSTDLHLSPIQKEMLKAAVLMYPALGEKRSLAAVQRLDEWRLVAPCLLSLEGRFDREGTRIPLLARALAALLSFHAHGQTEFREDIGRFDPEIVHKLSASGKAA